MKRGRGPHAADVVQEERERENHANVDRGFTAVVERRASRLSIGREDIRYFTGKREHNCTRGKNKYDCSYVLMYGKDNLLVEKKRS